MTLKGHYALRFKTHASFGDHHEKLNEDRPILSATRCSPMTLDSGNIRLMWILDIRGGSLEMATNNSGVIENVDFQAFRRYVFGTSGNEANIII